ncbi:TfuA-like protein [Actinokineospora auranticolor]|uniref:TfuA-like core domain-containing protein n=1 Tax=Actinokineospora auranticolor TaxID=155976 RepID=A0A2S6GJZ2_9PSEU|nr:TfuA-like protein [Actinokineospora auranticolor]PPK65548.1 hypothetical protein CLV40_11332 [Actinokineospora auranticolor]
MSVYIFLGPSLPLDRARHEFDAAVYLPPVRRGDVYRLVAAERPRVIGIVDGLFDTVPAVVHKEILFAISRGVRVLGAASMGALRAAELWEFGMEGVGRVFEKYRSGEWEADDEVAVLHGPAEVGFRAASVALATIRFGLAEARDRGIVSARTADVLVSAAREQFYPNRSWQFLYEAGARAGLPPVELTALRAFVDAEQPDAKRDDALALLRRVRYTHTTDGPPPHDFDFEENIFWERLTAETGSVTTARPEEQAVTNSDVLRHLWVQRDGQDRLRGTALLHLLDHYAATLHLRPSDQDIKAALARFRRRRGLLSAEQTRQWLTTNDITEDQLLTLLRLEVVLDVVLARNDQAIGTLLPLELKRRGEFGGTVRAVERKARVLRDRGVRNLSLEDAGVGFTELMDWYQSDRESLNGTVKEHAEALGFESPREFLSEVLLEYAIAETGRERP